MQRMNDVPAAPAAHLLCGLLFENLAVLEVLKTFHNAGQHPDLHFYRDSTGNEADLVLQSGAVWGSTLRGRH